MTGLEVALVGTCAVLVLLPPRYDPAIRLKEWLQDLDDRRRSPATICARDGHDWRHLGGRNAGCSRDCDCSIPVHECARCGNCDYGENAEAQRTLDECERRAEIVS